MEWWQTTLLVIGAGALGGFANALLADQFHQHRSTNVRYPASMVHNDVPTGSTGPSDQLGTVLTVELAWTGRPAEYAPIIGSLPPPSTVRMCVKIVVGLDVQTPAMRYRGSVRIFTLVGVDGFDSTDADRLLTLLVHTAESNFAHHAGGFDAAYRPPAAHPRTS